MANPPSRRARSDPDRSRPPATGRDRVARCSSAANAGSGADPARAINPRSNSALLAGLTGRRRRAAARRIALVGEPGSERAGHAYSYRGGALLRCPISRSVPSSRPMRFTLSYVREGLIRGQNCVADGREAESESEQESTIRAGPELLIRATNRGAGRRSVRVTAAAPRPANDYAVFAGQRGRRRRG